MKCPSCRAEVTVEAVYCPSCGTRLDDDPTMAAASDVTHAAETAPAAETRPRLAPRGANGDSPEVDLWQGGYSPKALVGGWVTSGAISIVSLVLAILFAQGGWWWLAVLVVILLAWLVPALTLAYRRLSIAYRVTSQRLFHESGILKRKTDRIELIDVDDVAFEQGIFERMLGVGNIRITSSDRSHPIFVMQGIDRVRDVATKIDNGRRAERLRRGLHIETV